MHAVFAIHTCTCTSVLYNKMEVGYLALYLVYTAVWFFSNISHLYVMGLDIFNQLWAWRVINGIQFPHRLRVSANL